MSTTYLITGKILFILFVCAGLWQPAQAQRNLVNVPQSEIVAPGKLFFQEQVTITDHVQSGTTFTFGLGKSWEAGLNINNVNLHYRTAHAHIVETASEHPEDNPDITFNIQKGIHLADWLDLGIGTLTGVGYINKPSKPKLASFSYLNSQFTIKGPEIKFYGGGYYTTPAYSGEGNQLGFMAGLAIPLISEKLIFAGDYLSGNNALSNFSAGLAVQLLKRWCLAAGVQIPSPGSDNPYGGIIQISTR